MGGSASEVIFQSGGFYIIHTIDQLGLFFLVRESIVLEHIEAIQIKILSIWENRDVGKGVGVNTLNNFHVPKVMEVLEFQSLGKLWTFMLF